MLAAAASDRLSPSAHCPFSNPAFRFLRCRGLKRPWSRLRDRITVRDQALISLVQLKRDRRPGQRGLVERDCLHNSQRSESQENSFGTEQPPAWARFLGNGVALRS